MKARRFLANQLLAHHLKLTALLLTLCLTAQAQRLSQTPVQPSADDARIARLVGLAKVWGAVKYFHPFLAYRDIDWDKALVETIPKVGAAKTPQEYQAAVNQMLAVLGDKSTRAEIETGTKAASPNQPAASAKEPVRVEDGLLLIEATRAARTGAQDINAFRRLLGKIDESIPTAKGVVIDGRDAVQTDDYVAYFFDGLLRQILPQMLDADVTLGSTRYRMHNGYPTPTTGANGDVTFMVLPGNLPVTFTGHNVRHADGRQLQRVGIQPAIRVAPTIHGVDAGHDEVLDRAVKYLQENVKK
ncbi:MAG TPA: hypothetical protein VGO96_03245 [Pyrinomonadaceae bacterium]|jgi:hypothetical protein|nr:hypothetical protein [Pyrinomonadaceae bacterium]